MSDEGENGQNGHELVEDSGRDASGRFIEGHQKLGGRQKGSMDFMAICRRKAKEENLDLDDVVWEAFGALRNAMKDKDVTAIKLLLDRTCGILEKGLEVSVDARQVHLPQAPTGEDLSKWTKRLLEIAEEEGGDDKS